MTMTVTMTMGRGRSRSRNMSGAGAGNLKNRRLRLPCFKYTSNYIYLFTYVLRHTFVKAVVDAKFYYNIYNA